MLIADYLTGLSPNNLLVHYTAEEWSEDSKRFVHNKDIVMEVLVDVSRIMQFEEKKHSPQLHPTKALH